MFHPRLIITTILFAFLLTGGTIFAAPSAPDEPISIELVANFRIGESTLMSISPSGSNMLVFNGHADQKLSIVTISQEHELELFLVSDRTGGWIQGNVLAGGSIISGLTIPEDGLYKILVHNHNQVTVEFLLQTYQFIETGSTISIGYTEGIFSTMSFLIHIDDLISLELTSESSELTYSVIFLSEDMEQIAEVTESDSSTTFTAEADTYYSVIAFTEGENEGELAFTIGKVES